MHNEELKKQILLMNYNNKKTLTENIDEILLEQGVIRDLVSMGKVAAHELEAFLKIMNQDSKVSKALSKVKIHSGGVTGIKDSKDLLLAIKLNKLTPLLKGELELAILRSNTTNKSLIDAAASNLVRNPKFISKYSADISKGQAQYEKALKNAKYSDGAITSIVKQTESLGGKLKTAEDIAKTASKTSKVAEEAAKVEALAKESYIAKYKRKFKEYYDKGKGKLSGIKKQEWFKKGFLKLNKKTGKYVISKRKILAWAAVAGVTYFALKSWLSREGVDEDTNKNNTGGGGSNNTGNTNNTNNKITYKKCSDFPYKKGCESPIISEVQKCLGVKVDGEFGDGTEKALVKGGYGTEITKEVYEKIKSKCGATPTVNTTTTTTLSIGQQYGTEPTPQEFPGGMSSSYLDDTDEY
jgi:hypothetical protein